MPPPASPRDSLPRHPGSRRQGPRPGGAAAGGRCDVALIALACRGPADVDGITHWSAAELGIAFAVHPEGGEVSARTVGRVLAWHYKRGDVHCVLDNASYHFAPEVKDWLLHHPRFHFHPTPTHASWLNQVECWFSLISRKAIRRGVFDCKGDLHSALMAYISQAQPFDWAYGEHLLEAPHAYAV